MHFKLIHNMLCANNNSYIQESAPNLNLSCQTQLFSSRSVAGNGTHDGVPVGNAESGLVRFEDGILFGGAGGFPDVPDGLRGQIRNIALIESAEAYPEASLGLVVGPVVPLDRIDAIQFGDLFPSPGTTGGL